MVFFNYALRKLNAKIVYYGPGLCGKTTNLAWIHDHFEGGERGKMISLATEGDRTIFFDLLPIEIGSIRGMDVTLQLYTVPGQVHYNSTRQLVLRGADGVVFVADSQRAMQSSNAESFSNLQENLLLQGIALDGFPLALQFNKRDLKDTLSVDEMNDDLNIYSVPIFEAVATEGVGVQETLEGIVKLVMRSLRERYEGAAAGPRTPGVADPSIRKSFVGQTPPTVAPAPAAEPPKVPEMPVSPPKAPVATESKPLAPEPPEVVEPPRPAAPDLPSFLEPPTAEDLVFDTDKGAQTTDFSKTVGPEVFGESQTGTGFEDEVSTAVYNVGDEDAVEIGPGDFSGDEALQEPPAQRAQAARPVFEDEPTNAVLSSPPEHEFATGGEGVEAPGSIDEEAGPETTEAPGFDVPQDSDPEIEFLPADDGDDTVPPTADLPPPSDRYVDRIVAPSPFAPRVEASEVSGIAAETVVEDEPIIADISEAVLQALGAEENAEVMAAVTGEDDEPAIEVTVAPDLDSDETVPFTPPPQPVMVMGEEDPFGVEEEPLSASTNRNGYEAHPSQIPVAEHIWCVVPEPERSNCVVAWSVR